MATTILKNNTGNKAKPNSNSTVLGNNLESKGNNQTIYGQFNDTTGTASDDLVQIGAGTSENDRTNALRVDKNGNVTLMGGEVYYDSTVGSIVLRTPIYMEGTDSEGNTITKKVYL